MNYLITRIKEISQAGKADVRIAKTGYFSQPLVININRFSLFIVFFWFGILKVLSISPAESLVSHLHEAILGSLISKSNFLIFLGSFECAIGILWLFPKLTKLAFLIFTIQMFTTFLPMIILPKETWQNNFVLTLTGQYIIKNLVLIASALTILNYFNNNPLQSRNSN